MTTILIILAAAYVQIKAASIWLFIVLYVSAGPLCLHSPIFALRLVRRAWCTGKLCAPPALPRPCWCGGGGSGARALLARRADRAARRGAAQALTFFFANFGPNATTFITPVELFTTKYRSTLHGISAASGARPPARPLAARPSASALPCKWHRLALHAPARRRAPASRPHAARLVCQPLRALALQCDCCACLVPSAGDYMRMAAPRRQGGRHCRRVWLRRAGADGRHPEDAGRAGDHQLPG